MPDPDPPQLSVIVPTLRNAALLKRVLDGYDCQTVEGFELIVVADPADPDPGATDRAIGERKYPVRRLTGHAPGASANRNAGWRVARAPVVLFTDDDTVPVPELAAEHLAWHARDPRQETAVVGHVRWAPEIRVTPFMRWLDRGVQFDFAAIRGTEASWGHLYSSNCSLKRAFVQRLGGYDEQRFPYGYEDLDLGIRGRDQGLQVLYNRRAEVHHHREMTVDLWRTRARRLAVSERRFCESHPEIDPYFFTMFSAAAAQPPQRGRAVKLARVVPRSAPWLGPLVWNLAELYWRQQIAAPFLHAWEASAAGREAALAPGAAALAERAAGTDSR